MRIDQHPESFDSTHGRSAVDGVGDINAYLADKFGLQIKNGSIKLPSTRSKANEVLNEAYRLFANSNNRLHRYQVYELFDSKAGRRLYPLLLQRLLVETDDFGLYCLCNALCKAITQENALEVLGSLQKTNPFPSDSAIVKRLLKIEKAKEPCLEWLMDRVKRQDCIPNMLRFAAGLDDSQIHEALVWRTHQYDDYFNTWLRPLLAPSR